MSIRTSAGALMTAALVVTLAPVAAGAATDDPTTTDPQVRLTGTLLTTVVERGPGATPDTSTGTPAPAAPAALHVGDQLVPVDPAAVADVSTGSTVTLDLRVPDTVVQAAEAERTLTLTDPAGRTTTYDLDRDDVADATGTPAAAGSELAAATTDEAAAPGAEPLEVTQVVRAQSATTSYTPASRRLTVVNVTPKGATSAPATTSQIQDMVTRTSTIWRNNSGGTIGVSLASIKPAYRSSYACTDPVGLWNEAAARVGYQGRTNESLVLVLPPDLPEHLGCPYGLATIGADPNDYGFVLGQGTSSDMLAHELGHNMSLDHSNLLICSSRAQDAERSSGTWATGCRERDYGDGQDLMSEDLFFSDRSPANPPSPMLSTPQAWEWGMLERSSVQHVPAGTTARVTLKPLAGRTGLRGATAVNARTGVRYWIEYRTPTGLDRYNVYGQSTGVRVLRMSSWGGTVLLDPTPTGAFDRTLALNPGSSVRSYDGHLTVRTVSATSTEAVVEITNARPTTFVVKTQPVTTGSRGVGKPLTVSTGTWNPTPTSYSYRWYRGTTAITGATKATYTPVRADAGRKVRAKVTARRSRVQSKAAWSSSSMSIPIYSTKRPTIGGTTRQGRTLTAYVGSWTPKPSSYAYRWYRDGKVITGATGKTYRLTSSDVGRRIKVRVTARRTGSTSGMAFSASTRTITR